MAKVVDEETALAASSDAACPFPITPSLLNEINKEKDAKELAAQGGLQGVARALATDLHAGLDHDSVEAHRQAYGENHFADKDPPSLLLGLWEAAQDPMIVILLVVAIVTIILGAAVPEQRAHNGWSEGVAVLGTALIVVGIGAWQDYSKEIQFQKINALKDIIEVKVHRGGKQIVIPNTEVVVGDVMFLDTGDKIIADGLVINAQSLVVDEASLTGESDPIKKDTAQDPWLRSGTTVNEGSGHMLVLAVGVNSEWGRTLAMVAEAGDDETPLQVQLTLVATQVSKMGVLVAVVCFFALFIKWLVENKGFNVNKINENGPLQFLLYAVTITVVSIPEGLPLAVTLTLAYSMKKMMKDNNFVRVLSACETMGGATAICSDKTGTLTENRMTVVEGWFCGKSWPEVPQPTQMSSHMLQHLAGNCAMNSKAFLMEQPTGVIDFIGNRTECALLVLLQKMGIDYKTVREEQEASQVKLYGFSSARKMASVLLKHPEGHLRLYNKGAAEWVLKRCVSLLNEDGSTTPLDEQKLTEMTEIVTAMAKRGLRCICLAYRDYETEDPTRPADFFEDSDKVDNGLIAYAIVGIKDPVRQEVPGAVAQCQKSGIIVRMVTGDNIYTAQHIARECGILVDGEGSIAMEGPTFRNMPATELIPLLPRLRVLARSSPEDKLTLVSLLKKQGEVVAVTGDGTNDAPALKESDVGLAMGIAGTEVAKEAADIIIMDDNFSSIVKSVLWGRCVFVNIRKFLVFQLSVNIVAMVSAAVGAIYGGVPPLNVLQLLWVNMIMDTLAALALATELPYPELLDEKPHGRFEPILTQTMYVNIVVAACYKLFWLLACLYGLPRVLPAYAVLSKTSYYQNDCESVLQDKGWNATAIPVVCNYMGRCGFPEGGDTRDTRLCSLYEPWRIENNTLVPSDTRDAVCRTFPAGVDCPWFQALSAAQYDVEQDFDIKLLDSYKPALSVLFNMFILAQVANAFISRRIGYEFDFFKGVMASPVFPSIMLIIVVLQVIIMQTPVGYIFKVQALNGVEWAVCIAVAFGAIVYSWAVRGLIRLCSHVGGDRTWLGILRGKRLGDFGRSPSARLTAARTMSGRTGSGRAMSGRGSVRVAPASSAAQAVPALQTDQHTNAKSAWN